jgi:hypothetical protein
MQGTICASAYCAGGLVCVEVAATGGVPAALATVAGVGAADSGDAVAVDAVGAGLHVRSSLSCAFSPKE